MRWDAATYGTSFADVYDDWYGERGDEDAVVIRLAGLVAGGRPRRLLELGVGTGRLAVPLAADGWHVVGLDASPAMLERLAARIAAIDRVLGDAADPATLPSGPFEVVLAAFNFLFNLADREAQARCLTACRDRIVDDGALVVEAFVPDPSLPAGRHEGLGPTTGVRVVTDADPATGVVVGEHLGPDGRPRPWRVCLASPAELDALASAAGWALAERHEDWVGSPFESDASPTHVSVYRPT